MVYFRFIHVLLSQNKSRLIARIISQHPGKQRIAVSLNTMIKQFTLSSSVALSEKLVRDVIDLICTCVPWFCRMISLNEKGCMSSQSSSKTTKNEQMEKTPGVKNLHKGYTEKIAWGKEN